MKEGEHGEEEMAGEEKEVRRLNEGDSALGNLGRERLRGAMEAWRGDGRKPRRAADTLGALDDFLKSCGPALPSTPTHSEH